VAFLLRADENATGAERDNALFFRQMLGRYARCVEVGVHAFQEDAMLYYAVVFFIIALIAGFFGFFGIAAAATGIAKILFFVFLVLAVVSLLFGRRAPV
jgi:uncharacterized membrane protein YtjA (UPF0391 family)